MSNLSKLNLPVKDLQTGEITMQEFNLPTGGSAELPFELAIDDGVYGYERLDGTFVPFKSQADIDSAVAAAMVGTATAGDVLTDKTFTNSSTSGVNGSMPNNGAVSASLNTGTTSYTIPAGYHNGSGTVSITTQEKSATPSTSAQNITPDSGKVLSKVSVSAISTQEKTSTPTTRSATAATVTPDSGKFLSKVTVNTTSVPNRYVNTNSVPNSNSGTYTFPANDTGGTKDLGAANSYRYVNAQNVYNKGKADAETNVVVASIYRGSCGFFIFDPTYDNKATYDYGYRTRTLSWLKVEQFYNAGVGALKITPLTRDIKISYVADLSSDYNSGIGYSEATAITRKETVTKNTTKIISASNNMNTSTILIY